MPWCAGEGGGGGGCMAWCAGGGGGGGGGGTAPPRLGGGGYCADTTHTKAAKSSAAHAVCRIVVHADNLLTDLVIGVPTSTAGPPPGGSPVPWSRGPASFSRSPRPRLCTLLGGRRSRRSREASSGAEASTPPNESRTRIDKYLVDTRNSLARTKTSCQWSPWSSSPCPCSWSCGIRMRSAIRPTPSTAMPMAARCWRRSLTLLISGRRLASAR